MSAKGYAIHDTDKWSDFKLIDYKLKTQGEYDIDIAIDYCGVCGSDIHTITGGWGKPELPVVVGHEIVGKVTKVGSKVTEFKVGDRAGVGAQVCSCFDCKACNNDNENYCPKMVDTYNAKYENGDIAQGGYSTAVRVHERFVFPIPDNIESNIAAPMLCAGLTVYSPLVRNGCGPGKKVGIVGIGGLGHFAVMWAKALGAEVYAFTHSDKKDEDIKKMGADHIINTTKDGWDEKLAMELDLIVSTVDVAKGIPLNKLMSCLNIHASLITVGLPDDALPELQAQDFMANGCKLGSSHIGSKKECISMLELASSKNIASWIMELPMSQAKTAVEAVKAGKDVRYRYVLKNDIN